jgi:hypothetical protein
MNTRSSTRRFSAGLAAVLLLAGCTAGATSSTGGPPGAAAPSAVATFDASARTHVSGETICIINVPPADAAPTPETTEPVVGPGQVYREGDDLTCTYTMSDPRVSGTERFQANAAVVDLPDLPGLVRLWDNVPVTLTAQGGTWKGTTVGAEFARTDAMTLWTFGSTVYQGQGAFAGLTYTLTISREARTGGEPYVVSGWIEPASTTTR